MELKDYLFEEYRRNNANKISIADSIPLQKIGTVRTPALKGEVDIIFRDELTGKIKEKIHGENEVTYAISDIFTNVYCGQLDYTKIMPIIPNLLGGVLCFQNPLNTNVMEYGAPCDNPVTAHAGNEAPASVVADLTRGAPNDAESYRTEHGFRQCWDWTASQGIGQISAVALTHKNTGNWWINDTEGHLQPIVRADTGVNQYYDANYDENAKKAPILADQINDVVYSFQQSIVNNVSTLTVNKWRMTLMMDISLMSECLQGERAVATTSATIELGQITSSNNHKRGRNLCYVREDFSHNKIYLYFVTSIRADSSNYGSRLEYGTIDTETLAYTYGGQILQVDGGVEARYTPNFLTPANCIRPVKYDDNGNLFMIIGKYHVANVPRIGTATAVERTRDISQMSNELMSTQGDFTVMGGVMTWGMGTTQEIPITPMMEVTQQGRRTIGGLMDSPVGFLSSVCVDLAPRYPIIGCFVNTMYLGTKFNLQEPVEKLGNQSMSVIYTLTEV